MIKNLDKNIIFVGMSLSGKTTLGYEISKKLGYNFIDTDSLIEKREKDSIKNIFTLKGEQYFRQCEKEILKDLRKTKKTLISTGGGLPIFNNNMNTLKDMGIVIFLKVELEVLIERGKSVIDRPLLKNDYEKKLKSMYEKRMEIYNKAHIIIELKEYKEENIDIIINSIKRNLEI
ncbi:MAG: shikimate kinase [Clostridium argentinense]|uniref:Shikimate kinase n=1 Tax=Clostridium faecium TaxID=2762223 RepID=A0ABR8YW29_9CLOT|nr:MULTISPECIES: shikimate kinase [Clostridium]MBD8048379.1 shikimate kinase [Clostridium faecium]MBS5823218.1 shikimate kinase [Clostridium argentinense]MDU1349012.1 shikimate kinase [Clostridium argentinense]